MDERRKFVPGSETGASGAPAGVTPATAARPGPAAASLPPAAAIGVCLHEIVQLSRAFERQVGQALEVNSTDLSAMEHLMQEGPLTPSELSRRLDISTAATTLVVDRLVALGHAQRHPHASDRRKVVVVPAPSSVVRAFEELRPVIGGVAALAEDLSAAERNVVAEFLARVVGVYRDSLLDGGPALPGSRPAA
ncbi:MULTISPECIES: MarR family winged helix-turn-helix transcriptional regulator [Cryobacterium]|uniref:MarR family winged helix-turn-helix transcriptional regulator n=1 Tax=Cryobacterium TaxID=69578 RepID=UPI001F544006|nr:MULTISPECIES: MarR family transcriptional regulator [Cryobacterium]